MRGRALVAIVLMGGAAIAAVGALHASGGRASAPAGKIDPHIAMGGHLSVQGAAVAGSALYIRDGCINCHGPNGLGGVPNPQSPDKSIPPLSGQDFRKEFNTDAKIIEFIRSGSVIGKAPITSMPHWGGILAQ